MESRSRSTPGQTAREIFTASAPKEAHRAGSRKDRTTAQFQPGRVMDSGSTSAQLRPAVRSGESLRKEATPSQCQRREVWRPLKARTIIPSITSVMELFGGLTLLTETKLA